MTNTAETGATAIKQISIGYIGRHDAVTHANFEPDDEALIFLNDDNEQTCHVEGPNAKAMAQQIVRAVNRDARFTDMVAALEEIAAKDRHFFTDSNTKYDGPYATIANRVLSSIKASTSTKETTK